MRLDPTIGVESTNQSFLPPVLPGCVLWLRADLGVTTVDAAVASPNDVSNVAWTKSNCTTPNATTIQDTNDVVATTHVVLQGIANLQTNHTATVSFEAKAGTIGFIRGQDSSGGLVAAINLTTGAVIAGSGVSVTDVGGGWWRVTIVGTCTNAAYNLGPCTAAGAYSYIGNGTGTVLVRAISVNQRNVSTWADRSGAAHDASQATAAKRPLWLATGAANGGPCVQGDAVDDRLVANWAQAQPTTTFLAHQHVAQPALNETLIDGGGGLVNALRVYGTGAGGTVQFHCGGALGPTTAYPGAGWHVRTLVANGASSNMYLDGGADNIADAGANASSGVCLLSAADDRFYSDDKIAEVIQYNRVLTTANRRAVERYLGARYSVVVA